MRADQWRRQQLWPPKLLWVPIARLSLVGRAAGTQWAGLQGNRGLGCRDTASLYLPGSLCLQVDWVLMKGQWPGSFGPADWLRQSTLAVLTWRQRCSACNSRDRDSYGYQED